MTTSTATPRRTSSRAVAAVGVALAGLALAGCSAGSSSDDAGSSAEMPAEERALAEADGAADSAAAIEPATQRRASELVRDRAVISTGVVALRSSDAGDARAEILKIVDVHRGVVTDEETSTDGDGAVERSRMVIRVPVSDFYDTVEELESVAELESSDKSSDDVSTEVIDTEVRIRAQERSLRRIEALLARAQSIRDIVSIESELTRRQAELDSLKSQQAYLADQTSMSTITVHLEQKGEATPKPEDDDATGFLSGFEGGWTALVAFGTVLATVAGALLPWLVVLAVLGTPVWLVGRRLVRRRPTSGAPLEG